MASAGFSQIRTTSSFGGHHVWSPPLALGYQPCQGPSPAAVSRQRPAATWDFLRGPGKEAGATVPFPRLVRRHSPGLPGPRSPVRRPRGSISGTEVLRFPHQSRRPSRACSSGRPQKRKPGPFPSPRVAGCARALLRKTGRFGFLSLHFLALCQTNTFNVRIRPSSGARTTVCVADRAIRRSTDQPGLERSWVPHPWLSLFTQPGALGNIQFKLQNKTVEGIRCHSGAKKEAAVQLLLDTVWLSPGPVCKSRRVCADQAFW